MPRPIPDLRTIREVEDSRDMTNGKPFRTKAMKAEAKRLARVEPDGSWFSPVERLNHATKSDRSLPVPRTNGEGEEI